MSLVTTDLLPPDVPDPPRLPREAVWKEFARAPLVPVAFAVTIGLVTDRYVGIPVEAGLLGATASLGAWVSLVRRRPATAVWFLWTAFVGLAAAHHHAHRHSFPADDVGNIVRDAPQIVRVRGVLIDDPSARFASSTDGFSPLAWADRDVSTVRVFAVGGESGSWIPTSGLARLTVDRERETESTSHVRPPMEGLRAGDAVEVVGVLERPRTPSNPGERDEANHLLDQRIRAELRAATTRGVIVRIESGMGTPIGLLGAVRRNASAAVFEKLSPSVSAVGVALLLGDGSAMDRTEWDGYVRTGVVHALAISGQHLVVLAGFLWFGMRVVGVRRSHGAWVVLIVVVGYTVLTGLRPSGVRAAALVASVCGGLILRRPATTANSFALGWLVVIALNPTDPFTLGCRLSFLSVFVLVWFCGPWLTPNPQTPLEQLIDESRSTTERTLRSVGRIAQSSYGVTVVIWAVNAPLLAADQNLVSPVGLLIGPPVVVLTSIALISGFLMILVSPLGVIAEPFAAVAGWALTGCGGLVRVADSIPGGSAYVAGVPTWWLVGFYLGLTGLVLLSVEWWKRCTIGLLAWCSVGIGVMALPRDADDMRVAFLAVGKGGCTVIETPDGRCILYDSGAASGPAVVRRVIAPYLWQRGVRRIDEMFLSHADADHFNGIGELLRRFPLGQVTLTPSFAEKPTREVAAALLVFERYRVPMRVAVAGDRFSAGMVEVEVLHPPPIGPAGVENERSLVLHIRHAGHSLLLTGDLEKSGTPWVLDQTSRSADVLMAPHHGSLGAAPNRLVKWCSPRLVVVSRGRPMGNSMATTDADGAPVWDTHTAGTITIRSHPTGLTAESFRNGEHVVVTRGGP